MREYVDRTVLGFAIITITALQVDPEKYQNSWFVYFALITVLFWGILYAVATIIDIRSRK